MTTDDERREVATRLRNNASQDMDWLVPWAVFNDAEQHDSEAVVRRLADLIEPSESGQNRDKNRDTVQIESPAVQKAPECDCDALLALADEIEYGASSDDGEYHDLPATMVAAVARKQMEYARRIREALGVVE